MLKGAYTLMITPLKDNGALDEDGLKLLVERQVESGIHGIAPLGVTGENTLLTDAEELKVLEKEVWIVDYKSKVDEASDYKEQLDAYKRISKEIYPSKVIKCFIISLEDSKIEEINE